MTKIEREIQRRRRRRLEAVNRREDEILRGGLEWAAIGLLAAAGTAILLWSGQQTEVQAATVVKKNHAVQTLYVPPIPAEMPTEGQPPEAIDITETEAAVEETGSAESWESLGVWKLTAYCPCRRCNGANAGKTASGAPMVPGRTVAVGGLPFGTELLINGQRYTVEDRGVTGHHVDILFPSHGEALEFGVQRAEVFIRR